ncbi:glycosyltransferase family 4 protein [Candidatus Peregrinibacteria bacterium]|nr:glycosyltransferase family 4 protein [Candidatus Peregrinibacteria bacterium]
MKPRIVILSAFATPRRSGAEACAEEVARELGGRYDIVFLTARLDRSVPKKDTFPGGVTVRRLGIGTSVDKWLYPFLAALTARRLRPKIIHAVLESYAGAALIFCSYLAPSAKRMLTCQSTNTDRMLKAMHRAAHRVTAISTVLQKRAKRFGKNAVLIPNGLRLGDIPRMEKIPGRIVFVGRLEPMKGVDVLLKAYAGLPALVREKTTLRIVGEGSEKPKLESLAASLKLGSKVIFAGFIPVPQVYREFAEAEIFAGLSRSEALGNVFLEAQAARCAVLATKAGGIPDIVKDRETGLLVPPDDIDAAREALETLLIDSGLRNRLAAAGKFHSEDFNWSTIAERYAEVYEELLA